MPAEPQHQSDSARGTTVSDGNLRQELARLSPDLLAVHHVTRIVVGDGHRNRSERAAQRRAGQELGDVLHARGEATRTLGPRRIALEQGAVGLHVGATPRRVHHHRVDALPLEDVDRAPSHLERPRVIAPVSVEGSAAALGRAARRPPPRSVPGPGRWPDCAAPNTTDWTQPVSSATRARRGPSAGITAGSGARSAAAGHASA